jgi:hypothetical protein
MPLSTRLWVTNIFPPGLLLRVSSDLAQQDEEKTSFTTPIGTYCYVRMPEGLKNAGSTFARMTKAVLGPNYRKTL